MKRRGENYLKTISLFQIVLLVSFAFSFSFILNTGVVSGKAWTDEDCKRILGDKYVSIGEGCGDLLGNEIFNIEDAGLRGSYGGLGSVFDIGSLGLESSYNANTPSLVIPAPFSHSKTFAGALSEKGMKDLQKKQTQQRAASKEGTDGGSVDETEIPPSSFMKDHPNIANIVDGFKHALGIVAAIQMIAPFIDDEETTNALSKAGAVGAIANGIFKSTGSWAGKAGPLEFTYGQWASVIVAAAVFIATYKKVKEKTVLFSCLPWQAPVGGDDCEVCNENENFPCSEYQCKSLGQSCEIVNKGTEEEKCVWINRNDVNPPMIKAWKDILLNNYIYTPDNAVSPPDRGVKILYESSQDNCVPAFTPLRLGVSMDEPAACKIDTLRKNSFDEMLTFMGGGLSKYNHSYSLVLPSQEALDAENITIENDGNFKLYVRCQDSNGNSNTANFQFRYCVDQGPDTTAPLIVSTNLLNGAPIAYNQSSIDLDLYVNEPAECMWDHNDRNYETMQEQMSCSTSIFEYNAQMLYKCSTTLTGLKDRTENKFYFRCKDKPNSPENERNTNTESFEFSLMGTRPLVIDSVEPDNEIIKDSTSPVKITIEARTSAGYEEGKAICYFSDSCFLENGDEDKYTEFLYEDGPSYLHSQELWPDEGNYQCSIRCVDLGGNSDTKDVNFTIETDLTPPTISRAYKEDNYLKLITNEEARCVYSTFGCNYDFDEGTQITVRDKTNHFTEWDTQKDLYVKCEDKFGKRPLPNQCSMVVRASDF